MIWKENPPMIRDIIIRDNNLERVPMPYRDHRDDVVKWKHFPRYWPFVRGIHRSPVNAPHKGQWRGALMRSLICVWVNAWVNNRDAGELRRYRAHYDVTVMMMALNDPVNLQQWPPHLFIKYPYVSLGFACCVFCVSAKSEETMFGFGSLQWRHNESDGVSYRRHTHCLLNCWFRHRSKETSKLRVTGLCQRNSSVTGEFLAQRANNAENVSIWWRHRVILRKRGHVN